ncbi:MAG: putative zn-dependent protease transrane protein [Phycisphaerales bacterium]|nr:putative zn-dependent protease transrane protein [Phycisphaerales bacterium]
MNDPDIARSVPFPPGYITTPAQSAPTVGCPSCGARLADGTLVCTQCGTLVNAEQLNALANEAMRAEQENPYAAAQLWRRTLDFLPRDSEPYAAIHQRIGQLSAGMPADAIPPVAPPIQHRRERANDPWPLAVAKTVGSMLLSVLIYANLLPGGWRFAAGFVALMLVHEMGHVVAMWYYGLSASPPIFIPFLGALINLRQDPPNAKVEAIVGIGGPLAGTVGALICYALYHYVPALHTELMLDLAYFGFILNLFNLLPVPPLDGGRITAAVSPWIWMFGLAALVLVFLGQLFLQHTFNFVMLLILFFALPRIRATLRAHGRDNPYYRISRASSWTIAGLYVTLAAVLILATLGTQYLIHYRFGHDVGF